MNHYTSISVPLNIAEGSGKTTKAQKYACYAIARGEAMECAAIIDILKSLHMIDCSKATAAKDLLVHVVSILSSVCKRKT